MLEKPLVSEMRLIDSFWDLSVRKSLEIATSSSGWKPQWLWYGDMGLLSTSILLESCLQAAMKDLGIHQARHNGYLISNLVVELLGWEYGHPVPLPNFTSHQYCRQGECVMIGKCGNQALIREISWIMQTMRRAHKRIMFFVGMTPIFPYTLFPALVFKKINFPFLI